MKTTTTLYDYLQSELINSGKNEFFNDNQLTFFNDEYTFMMKVLKLDDDVLKIINRKMFLGFTLDNLEHDKHFKRAFVTKFLHREIGYQTIEMFSSQVITTSLNYEKFLNTIYSELDEYINGKTTGSTKGNGTSLTDNRNAFSDLPSDEVNTNVDNLELDYATNNTINRNKNVSTNDGSSQSEQKNLDNLLKTQNLLSDILNQYDKNCFLQRW